MSSVRMLTLVPSSVTTSPFTVTTPLWMSVSASLREQTPELAMYLFRRTTSLIGVFAVSSSDQALPLTCGLRLSISLMPSSALERFW